MRVKVEGDFGENLQGGGAGIDQGRRPPNNNNKLSSEGDGEIMPSIVVGVGDMIMIQLADLLY